MAASTTEAPAEDRFALHLAVWDDDADRLQALLMTGKYDLEALDPQHNTPLLLAYRMGRTKLARMLLAAGSFPKARTPEGFEAIQVAALTANPDLVRESVLAFLSETDAAFERRLPALQRALAALPDFVMRITWEFSSWVPLVSRMLPSDTWNVSKRGSSLRLDSTLLGMNGLAWERGSVSLILWGSDMPRPGATFVLDNEAKTAADARMAFNHPQDMHIQDWVRKLLTQKQKTTDFWTRDVAFTPVLKKGLLSSLGSKLGRLAFGESAPRGRLTDPRSPPASAGSGSAAGGDDGEEGAVSASMSSFLSGAPASPAAAPASPAAEAITHVPNPQQVKEDVGVWSDCVAYEMRNLCIRDLTHAPILPELKLASWWKPEYSRQATAAEVAEAEAAAKGPVAGEGAAGAGAASPAAAAAASPLVDDAPEKRLGPLLRAIQAIRSGKINERNAASATVEELEGMGFEGEGGAKVTAGHTVESVSFAEYWGYEAPAGSTHKPTGAVAVFKEDALTVEDKSLDLKVLFSPEFPITPEAFLPVAEIMARTGRHAENFRAFFQSKLPVGAGFPVRFSIPALPTITATINFEHCDTRRSPSKLAFVIPEDYKMGAYVDKGWIRQL